MISGLDISHHQDPAKFDWPAVAKKYGFVICRASYGRGTADRHFKRFSELVRGHGIKFGAYLFYRQTHTVRDQLALFNRQLELVGGLVPGDIFPVLDMEHNAVNGDGEPVAARFSADCREIAEAFRAEYGGAILYYSSYFPEYLKAHKQPALSQWMKETGYFHWLADYGRGSNRPSATPGVVRQPYTPNWHVHQYTGFGRIPEYASGKADIDLNVLNPHVAIESLLVKPTEDVSEEAREGEGHTDQRPGGCDDEAHERGTELVRQGLSLIQQGLDELAPPTPRN